jgi:Asp-tRNA(Asn)/Glu-tRNA(Gln) amidotransferase A subunit family amidase
MKAIEKARERDWILKEAVKNGGDLDSVLPSLHGIPFSVKDMLYLKGTRSTLGTSSLSDKIIEIDSHVVTMFEQFGAIPFVKGNIPVLALSYHSKNAVFGEAKNPWNLERTCGGSSGGEAALIASNCSPMGLGTDLGGSLRVPAHFNGITCLMPSQRWVSLFGHKTFTRTNWYAYDPCVPAIGPLSRTVDDIKTMFEVLCET